MQEHPFAQYVRILGKGRKGARSLTQEEAFAAMDMIARYEVEPEQLGAFMMLMRVKEETAAEVAGFVQALRNSIPVPAQHTPVAIDWPSYAGKRRQMPWYLMAAVILSQHGYPVFMHGLSRDDERVYTEQVLEVFDLKPSRSLSYAVVDLQANNFAYLDVVDLSTLITSLLDTRDLLGLRSPLHTVARMLNPFNASLSIQPVFHPNYAEIHQQASLILAENNTVSFKGEGGEAERIPERECHVYGMSRDQTWEQKWPALLPPDRYGPESFPDLEHFRAVWLGKDDDSYAEQAVCGTMAIVLSALESKLSQEQAMIKARTLWQDRHRVNINQAV
jgi:anthranilate phosphoribosyltransferase